jgi:ketosteroid isomerase-like protein
MRPEDVAIEFNQCINRRDLAGLAELMTEDHAFTDTLGATVPGKAQCVEAWRGFFARFPDYRNTFTEVSARGELAIAVGYSTCAFEALNGPAIWTAAISDGKVSHWRVYADTHQVRSELDLRHTLGGCEHTLSM